MSSQSPPITVVAIPACNEADLIGACLTSLDGQLGAQLDHIVVLANNCSDDTAARARRMVLRGGTRLHVLEVDLPPKRANAGHARGLAMQFAAVLAGADGVLLTTDADGRVDPCWLAANLAELAAGAQVVAGWCELDAEDWSRIPLALHEADAEECAYDALCDALHAALDSDPWDPLPRHTQHSGASIAVTAQAFQRCGGVPDVSSGEDRGLITALRRIDARIRHSPDVRVVVSGRTEGRAPGGMADTIRRRLGALDTMLDDRLEPALDCVRRATGRRLLREVYETRSGLGNTASLLEMPPARICMLLERGFGEAWHAVEAESPALQRRGVLVSELSQQMEVARRVLATLIPDDRCDRAASAGQILA